MHRTISTRFALALALLASACTETDAPPTAPGAVDDVPVESNAMIWHRAGHRGTLTDAVKTWNDNIEEFGVLAFTPPPNEARMVAMANTTVHDILNAVDRRFEPYAYDGRVRRPVSVEAAIATGAYEVLANLGKGLPEPAALDFITKAYSDYMAALGACDEITRGTALGHDAAAAMLARRADDGSTGPPVVVFTSTGEPGKFRSPVGTATALTGPEAIPYWGTVKPFVIMGTAAYQPGPMYGAPTVEAAVKTPAYLADYAEVKRLGGMVSERTQDQTDIGIYWIESPAQGWNRAARILAEKHNLNAWRLARLMAHVHMADADGFIAVFATKFHYNFWRPVTAIRLGNLDPGTPGDPNWQVGSLLIPELGGTPPFPDYSSAHATAGGAVAEAILADLDGSTAFTMESATLPGKPRSFGSVLKAARENADSRVYVGFHFRHATDVGLVEGRAIGAYVGRHSLQRAWGR